MTSIQSKTEYDFNTTTIQMEFRRNSNGLFESESQEFMYKLPKNVYYHIVIVIYVEE